MGIIEHENTPPNPEIYPKGKVELRQSLEVFNENTVFDVFADNAEVGVTILNINEAEPSVIIEYFELKEEFRGRKLATGYYQGVLDFLINQIPDLVAIESVPTDKPAMVKVRHRVVLPDGWGRYYSRTAMTDGISDDFSIHKLAAKNYDKTIPGITENLEVALSYIGSGWGVTQVIERRL